MRSMVYLEKTTLRAGAIYLTSQSKTNDSEIDDKRDAQRGHGPLISGPMLHPLKILYIINLAQCSGSFGNLFVISPSMDDK